MRLATCEHLIAAEDIADAAAGSYDVAALIDTDMDGFDEVRLASIGQVVTVDPNEGAGIGGWDIRAVRHALTAVMRRRPEAYHELVRTHSDGPPTADSDDAAASIHDVVRMKEPGLKDRLHYDPFERRSALVRFLPPTTSVEDWAAARGEELGDAIDGAYRR